MPVRRVKRTKPSGRQFSIFGGAMYGMRKMRARPLPRGLMLQGAGRRVRRRRMGRGFLDTLKNIGSRALSIARSVPIASTALSLMGPKAAPAAGIARSLGFGRMGLMRGMRRVRRVRRRVGGAKKRRVKRRVGMGLLSSLMGMAGLGRKRRVRRRRMGGAVRRLRAPARRRYVR
jgi:hypothetical protein